MATASATPPAARNGASASTTPALAPAQSNTKRLSMVKASPGTTTGNAAGANGAAAQAGGKFGPGKDVMSPGELCGFVDTMMSQLETRFDEFSEQMLSRSQSKLHAVFTSALSSVGQGTFEADTAVDDMSTRIDNLENTIQDLMHSDIDELDTKPISTTPADGK